MVEVFKTNVQERDEAKMLLEKLLEHFPHNRINFDLNDCDSILRVEGERIYSEKIIELLERCNYCCEILS